jgi:hypothetical protein
MMRLLACLVIAAGGCSAAYANDIPKFKEYPANIYNGSKAPIHLDTQEVGQYRTQLRDAIKGPINFGGHYVFTQLGAGTRCDTGAIIDVATGEVYFLPFAACNWAGFDRPFEFRKNSRLLVVAGQVGEDGPRGAHFFEFTGKEFKIVGDKASSPISLEPAAGPSEAVDSVDAQPMTGVKETLQPQLWGALNRAGFQKVTAQNTSFSGDEISRIADVLLATSFRQPLEINGVKYDLLYNWQSDLFMLVRYKNGIAETAGFLSGTAASQIYKVNDDENILRLMLVARPALAVHFAKDLHLSKDPDRLFRKFIVDEDESLRVQNNLMSALTLLNRGIKDPCRQQAKAYLQSTAFKSKITPDGQKLTFYTGVGFPTSDGRVLAFGDEATNQYVGFLVFDQDDTTSCKPKSVLTSRFQP